MTRFSSLVRSSIRKLVLLAGLAVIPATAAMLPSVYNNPTSVVYYDVSTQLDTTYSSGSFVLLYDVACMGGICTVDGTVPDEYYLQWKPDITQLLLFTYETGHGTALDSAVVDSIWSDWSYTSPYAYMVNVPGTPPDVVPPPCDTCTITDTLLAYWHWNPDRYDSTFALLDDAASGGIGATWSRTEIMPTLCRPYNWVGQDSCPIFLDTLVGYGPFSKSVRADYLYPDSASMIIAQTRSLPHTFFTGTKTDTIREMWVEISVRSGPEPGRMSGCRDGAAEVEDACDHKTYQLIYANGDGAGGQTAAGRYSIHYWGAGGATTPQRTYIGINDRIGADSAIVLLGGEAAIIPTNGICNDRDGIDYGETINDGDWHLIQHYVRLSSTNEDWSPTTNSMDANVELWLDHERIFSMDSVVDAGTCQVWGTINQDSPGDITWFRQFKVLGYNKDDGGYYGFNESYPLTEKYYVGHVSIFTTNPGWPRWAD